MIYILLECEKTKSVAEFEFFELIWRDELLLGLAEIRCCGGNTNFETEFRNLPLVNGDSVYIHYDMLNTFEKGKAVTYFSLLKEIQCAMQNCNFNIYILNYMSFEHMILMTTVISTLLAGAIKSSTTQKKMMYLSECLECLNDLYNMNASDSFSTLNVGLAIRHFPKVFKDTVANTREQYISHICDQLSKLGNRFFHCTKSTLGICWKTDCFPNNHQEYCLKDTAGAICTSVCDTGVRLSSILASLGLTDREQLYLPLILPTLSGDIGGMSDTIVSGSDSKTSVFE